MTLEAAWIALALALAALTLPGTLELALVTLGAALPPRRHPAATRRRRLVAVVPAHDEQASIARCVASLRRAFGLPLAPATGDPEPPIVVVADNCSDETAERARGAGARVLVRHDVARRGKGYALDFAFRILLEEGAESFVVIDADTEVEANLCDEIQALLAEGADAVQTRYGVRNPGASLRTRLMNVALMAFNVLRPRGRERWGMSVGILGNGFALTRETLLAVPYDAHSVVEDLEYHLRLVESGRAVRFADRTTVRADMPLGGRGAATQRARWEGGRLRMIGETAPTLARRVAAGELRLLEPLLELLLLPLATHVSLLLVALALPLQAARLYAGAGLALVGMHVLVALAVGGAGWRDLLALGAAPAYIAWKAALAPAMARAARRDSTWVRTERATEDNP